MAANGNDNTDSAVFKKLTSELQRLYLQCEHHKSYYDELCRKYKTVLSPWPKGKETVSESESANNAIATQKETTPVLDPEEEKKLLMAEKALSKAQKIWNYHDKRAATLGHIPVTSHANASTNASSNCSARTAGDCRENVNDHPSLQLQSAASFTEKQRKPLVTAMSRDTAVIAESQLNKLLQSTKSANRKKTMKKSPTIATSRTAPFKTDPVPMRRLSAANSKRKAVTLTNNHSARPCSAGKTYSQGNARSKSAVITSKRAASVQQTEQNHQQTLNGPCDQDEKMNVRQHSYALPHFETDTIAEQFNKMNMDDQVHKSKPQKSSEPESSPDSESFDLLKQGSEVPIPPKLKQLVHKNCKLRDKLKNMKQKKKGSPEDSFIKKLHHYYKKTESPTFVSTIQLTAVYMHLKKLLGSLNKSSLQDDTPWKEVLRYKQLLDYIFSSFVSLEDQYHCLTDEYEIDLPQLDHFQLKVPQPSKPDIWLPDVQTAQPEFTRKRWMKYPNLKAKLKYHDLMHQYQMLLLHKRITEIVAKEALPLLQSKDVYDSDMRQLYRCTYSMLVTLGQRFPALVTDVSESDEEDELDF